MKFIFTSLLLMVLIVQSQAQQTRIEKLTIRSASGILKDTITFSDRTLYFYLNSDSTANFTANYSISLSTGRKVIMQISGSGKQVDIASFMAMARPHNTLLIQFSTGIITTDGKKKLVKIMPNIYNLVFK